MTEYSVELNVDMGESYGRWQLGDDAALMPYIAAANIATGAHAGDPTTMRITVEMAVSHGVQIGAHVGLPDVLGFGRRRMAISVDDMHDMALAQMGALDAFCRAAGGRLGHVKPHGSLYAMLWESEELTDALARAMNEFQPGLPLYAMTMGTADAAARHGVSMVQEAFVDLWYDGAGTLLIERTKLACDPELAAGRAIRLVREGKLQTNAGNDIDIAPRTICLHGDAPNSIDVVRTVRTRLEEAGIAVEAVVGTGARS